MKITIAVIVAVLLVIILLIRRRMKRNDQRAFERIMRKYESISDDASSGTKSSQANDEFMRLQELAFRVASNSAQMSQGDGALKRKHELASQAAVTYTLQYLVDQGRQPSRETVVGWILKLETLPEAEILRLHGDIETLKQFLRAP